ncbi:MAG: hypothetical protein Tsb0034_11710 [Ekhidna sp.]
MALGKNLKKKKLIEKEAAPKPTKKAKAKKVKKVVAKKKLINEEKPIEQPAKAPTITQPKKEESVVDQSQKLNSGLPIYIAQVLHRRKVELRNKYKKEVENLQGESVQFVVFQIGGESYALDMHTIKEVVPIPDLSKTPNTPPHIKGIASVRGNTYVVFDLATKFKVIGDEFPKYLLVVHGKGIIAAILLSTLPTTLKTKGDNISSELHMIEDASLDVSYIKGLIQHEGKLIYYLDILELLKNDKAIVVPENLPEEA